ncbi:hypothetical protein C3489_12085 [Streptomyces sp. Ru71]|uniref:putative quinol monooxygenase n=1 Tax=Streptomyces sp. Ru71 TaxID=2080746 RepID=UPI000CDCF20F|nr:antibiotic biosynthesis monooxygenase [Streptomyces sp. Ru71]POX55049.1 hypothetical protein C3489_12085 [Streptomyces sp. Ru71]
MAADTRPVPLGTPPDIRRSDVRAVFVTQWYVPGRAAGLASLDEVAEQWAGTPWPTGILSFAAYLGTDDDTALTYVQASRPDTYRPFVRALRGPARAEGVEYRLRRSVVLEPGLPGAVVVASFDVDGPERQERIIESVAGAVTGAPAEQHPGMLTANFHASTDGTRVLNYAEWTTDEAHVAFLAGATRRATLRATGETPGVRPIGFKRYHLHRSISIEHPPNDRRQP